MQQHAVHPRKKITVTQMDPTATKVAPELELAEELVAAGLNVLVCISFEVGTAVLPGGLPEHKNHDHTESKSVSLHTQSL